MLQNISTPWAEAGTVVDQMTMPVELDFEVHTEPLLYTAQDGEYREAPGVRGIINSTTQEMLGTTGRRYTPYQNQEWWDVITAYAQTTGGQIERGGKFGSFGWAVVKHNDYEVIPNDPITKYDMFINPFTGTMSVTLINTDVRVVCGNALHTALRNSQGLYRIRHTSSVDERVRLAVEASAAARKARDHQIEYLSHLTKVNLTDTQTQQMIHAMFSVTEESSPRTWKRVDLFNELLAKGRGAELQGVRGTAYGFYQAAVEYADHHMNVRNDKVESTLLGSIAGFKTYAAKQLNQMLQIAA